MTPLDIAAALHRAQDVLRRRPGHAIQPDSRATASWSGGLRVVTTHPKGLKVETDMPRELGGTADQVTPGWLMRAGLASCAATSIAMAAAVEGIELTRLDVEAGSVSDTRGVLGMSAPDGTQIDSGPTQLSLTVRIGASNVPPDRLRLLVEQSNSRAPVSCALRDALAVDLRIEVYIG